MRNEIICFEHEYYDDKEGGRIHCWFPTYMTWEEYSFGKCNWKHISTIELTKAAVGNAEMEGVGRGDDKP